MTWPWEKTPPAPAPAPTEMPTSFIVCSVMWFIHGFILDIVIIGVLPFISASVAHAQRADKFPWALGGYAGFEGPDRIGRTVLNLAPTHRRFITENAAYALLRIAPAFFTTNLPVLLMCVISYAIEAITIAWEQISFGAPANSMLPQTLMAVFASVVTYTATTNEDGYIPAVEPAVLLAMQSVCALTWVCWGAAASFVATRK